MCEISTVLLATVAAGIIAAIASVGVAVVLNNGFCTAPASPAAMIVAGASTLVAVGALSFLLGDVNNYYQCMGSPAACDGELSNVTNAINALRTVLGIQATACFVAAGIAWIPWAGAAPMYVILASLITQLALVPSLYIFLGDLASCANSESAQPAVGAVVGIAAVVAAVSIGLTAYIRRESPWNWQAKT